MKQVWYLWQENESFPTLWFDKKETAEKAARMLFPEESESKRYLRVFYRDILTMADLNGG